MSSEHPHNEGEPTRSRQDSKPASSKNSRNDKNSQSKKVGGLHRRTRLSASSGLRGSIKGRGAALRSGKDESELLSPSSTALRKDIPAAVLQALKERGLSEEKVLIATDSDLDILGAYSDSWIIVTEQEVLMYWLDPESAAAVLTKEVAVADIDKVRTDTRVGSGFLEAKTGDAYQEIARYSNKHAEKFAKIAAQLRALVVGREVKVLTEEEEERETEEKIRQGLLTPPVLRVRRGTVFFRFLRYTKPFWPHTVLAMVLVVGTIALNLVPPQLTRVLIDQVIEQKPDAPRWFSWVNSVLELDEPRQWLYMVVSMLAATTLLVAMVGVLRECLSMWINNRLGYDLRGKVFEKLEDLGVRYHERQHVGQLMTRCSQDTETLQGFIQQLTSGFGYQLLLVIGVALAMFFMNWRLALIACVPAPAVMLSTILFYRHIVPKWRKFWTRRSDLMSSLHASLSGIRVVKAFAQENREGERFGNVSHRFLKAGLNVGYAQAMFYPPMSFVFQLGSYFIWVIGGSQIIDPGDANLTIGELIAFLGYLGMFYAPLNSLTQMSTWFTQFTTQAHRVFEILDQEPEIRDSRESIELELQGAIEFKNVHFGYDPHLPVLKDISFKVSPGEMIGIVGHSGCGKSTTVSLITRFYDPNEGEITLDNTKLQNIRKHCLRRQIGLVAQDPHLFRGTVAENVAYGNPEVAPELVLNAALQANAHMFIVRNHDGYDARLGERGAGLSGGERQRVAIARALVHNPRVLILDEATSSVDTISEREIQNALEALSQGRTTIAIAHRLSTLKNCDRILVFEEGEIREHGSHEELMGMEEGIYHKLVMTQMELATMGAKVPGGEGGDDREVVFDTGLHEAPRRERNTEVPRIHYLDPKKVEVQTLNEGDLRVIYEEKTYDHVRAYRCFPVSRPTEFIAFWTGETALEHKEIGMVRHMNDLSPDARLAVEYELAKRYFIHYIDDIYHIKPHKDNIGYLVWDVLTDKGEMTFVTRRYDRHAVVEGGENGRIIHDIDDNRYEIVDLEELPKDSQALFLQYIYW